MKKVTKYEAADGTLFDSQKEAIDHETLCAIELHLLNDESVDWSAPADSWAIAKSVLAWLERRGMPDAATE